MEPASTSVWPTRSIDSPARVRPDSPPDRRAASARAVRRRRPGVCDLARPFASLGLAALLGLAAPPLAAQDPAGRAATPPNPDPRVGLGAGLFDAEEAVWNLRVVSTTPPPAEFIASWNSDLAFTGDYVIQGSFLGFNIWDVSDPSRPELVTSYVCPGSQGDVSVYGHLLFVSVEGPEARLDCGTQGNAEAVSAERLSGIRIFDISDIRSPKLVTSVQTCRGSHTHSVLEDPNDPENLYIYNSGVTAVRSPEELPGCSGAPPQEDPGSVLSTIEVIVVPLANPEQAAVATTPRILEGLVTPPRHGPTPEDVAAAEEARARGAFVVGFLGEEMEMPPAFVEPMLASLVEARGGEGPPTAADSAALRELIAAETAQVDELFGGDFVTMCHDITLYPAIGKAGAACLGYGLLLDVTAPDQPVRLDAVADSNFVAWHSATFSNDGTKLLFTDEWGGGLMPKCREADPLHWGANAIYRIEDGALRFRSYYKMPAAQTPQENCVAHNGSLIPIPGRDVMVQSWMQGGVSVFDWTDPDQPFEIAFHDRGPISDAGLMPGGSWSAYWYNGLIVSSEIARGLDIFALTPSEFLTRNEIDAANTVRLDYLNVQGQPRFVWPPSFALARAYLDQLERSGGLDAERIAAVRHALAAAEQASGDARRRTLTELADELDADATGSGDPAKVRTLARSVRDMAEAAR